MACVCYGGVSKALAELPTVSFGLQHIRIKCEVDEEDGIWLGGQCLHLVGFFTLARGTYSS